MQANKSNALLLFSTGQYRPSCAALYKSIKSSIATGHFSFLAPPLQSQSNLYACETESKKRIFLGMQCIPKVFPFIEQWCNVLL
jgi:hypothetical protein